MIVAMVAAASAYSVPAHPAPAYVAPASHVYETPIFHRYKLWCKMNSNFRLNYEQLNHLQTLDLKCYIFAIRAHSKAIHKSIIFSRIIFKYFKLSSNFPLVS